MAKKNHNKNNCKKCYQNFKGEKGCQAFTDKEKVILNDNGRCTGKITSKKKYKELLRSIGERR